MKIMRDQVWTEEVKSGELNVGFTQRFINDKLPECFHVLQADSTHLFEGSPMLVIETNDGLESIKSPITGTVIMFNAKARNFPDRITEEDVILTVVPKGIKVAMEKKVTYRVSSAVELEQHLNVLRQQEERDIEEFFRG